MSRPVWFDYHFCPLKKNGYRIHNQPNLTGKVLLGIILEQIFKFVMELVMFERVLEGCFVKEEMFEYEKIKGGH